MRKGTIRKDQWLLQGHSANWWQRWDLNQVLWYLLLKRRLWSLLRGHPVERWFHQQKGVGFHEMGLWMPTCASDKSQFPVSFVAELLLLQNTVFLRAGREGWPLQIKSWPAFSITHKLYRSMAAIFSFERKTRRKKNIYESIHGKTWKQLTVVLGHAIWNVCRHLGS